MAINIYQKVTDRIIAELEKGNLSWEKPWTGTSDRAFNRISKKPYSLLNQLLLSHRKSSEFATMSQWNSLGGKIKRGAKADFVVFWKIQTKEERQEDGTIKEISVPILRYYNLFSIEDVEGVEPLQKEALKEFEPIEEAERILNDYWTREHITVEHVKGDEAYYSPHRDLIRLPLKEQFTDVNLYYGVATHESIHSTLLQSRCNREQERKNKLVSFGSVDYSKEELVAELGSAMLLNLLGIETKKTVKQNASYIKSWIQVLKNDNRFIISASTKAEKAVNYILATE